MVKAKQASAVKAKRATAATTELVASAVSENASEELGGNAAPLAQARLLRDRYPALTDDEVAYFEARQPVEQARAEGGRTVAADVLIDAVRLGARYEHARAASATVASLITAAQMRWLFEQLVKLGEAVAKRDRHGTTTTEVSLAVQQALEAARSPRNALTGAMTEYAKGSESDQALLGRARGTANTPDAALSSLNALTALADAWLARTDAMARIAAREASLTAALVEQARDAAATLRAAIEGDVAHPGNRRTARDTPEINVLEGRVLLTLRTVRHNHQRAMERDPVLEAVAVPESLRHPMRVNSKTKVPSTPTDPNAPADATTKKKRTTKR